MPQIHERSAPSAGGAHPDLAAHDTLGLATQAELDAHGNAADPHAGYLKESDVAGAAGASAFSDVAGAGVAATAAKTDHKHGREANPVTAHEAAADPHTGYQKESERNVASGYSGLDASTLLATAQHGTGTADATTFLRGDRTWATPTGAPTPDARLTTKVMAADQADITGITLVALADLTVAALPAGSYQFTYRVIYQTTATTTGVEFVVDSLATVDRFVSNMNFGSTGGAAATGIADQQGVGTAAGLMETKTARANNTRPGVTIGVDTINADMLMVIEGVIRTTTAGDLRLMMAAEAAALVCRARAGSSLVLIKTS